MKKKLFLLLALVMAFSVVAVGCGQSKVKVEVKSPEEAARMEGDPVQNLAIKEKEWLGRLDTVRGEISQSFTAWEQGKVTKEEFISQLNKPMATVKVMIKEYNLHMEVNNFPEDKENEELYKDGLYYGKKLRSTVNDFIFMATEGIMDSKTNKLKVLTDDQIKGVYTKYMVEKYDKYKGKLEPALEQANKK